MEISIGNPYTDKPLDINRFLRKFDKNVDEGELIWHRDKKTRIITVMGGNNWKLQFDDQLPVIINPITRSTNCFLFTYPIKKHLARK